VWEKTIEVLKKMFKKGTKNGACTLYL